MLYGCFFVIWTNVLQFFQPHQKDSIEVDAISMPKEKNDAFAHGKGVSVISNLRK